MTRTLCSLCGAAAIAVLLLGVAFARAATADSGSGPTGVPVQGNFSLERARAVPGLDLFYVGESIAGLPLSAVERRDDDARYTSFLYGDCTAGDHYGCALPLEIQTWPSCLRSLSLYDESDPLAPRPQSARVRGVAAVILDEGRQLELQSGSSTVVIFGETKALVNRAAAALRGANNDLRPGEPLRPPGAIEQPCR